MPLTLFGISHRHAPLTLRERLAFQPGELSPALELARTQPPLADAELVILSTCNRTELYLAPHQGDPAVAALTALLVRSRGISASQFVPACYRRVGVDAVRHLARVATGLESMVVGEAEILGQVGDAREAARTAGTLGPILSNVFDTALRTGRRARAETLVGREPASISGEAVALLKRTLGGLEGRRLLLLGTGSMARRVGSQLRGHVAELLIAGRTRAHAADLAAHLGGASIPWEARVDVLERVDGVVSATAAPLLVLTADQVASARGGRGLPVLVLVDTAVPRSVDPAVRTVAGVQLFDLDDLQRQIHENLEARARETARVEGIVAEEVSRFEQWYRGAALGPLIGAMRRHAEDIRRGEVARALHQLPGLPEQARERIEQLSRVLVNKLLHQPTVRLRADADPALHRTYAQVAELLFGPGDRGGESGLGARCGP